MEEMLTTISNLGFPIALSMYLLVRIETKLERLTEAIKTLSDTLNNE